MIVGLKAVRNERESTESEETKRLTVKRIHLMPDRDRPRPERELRERRHEITSLLAVNRRTDERKAVSRRYFYSIPCYERHVND